MKTFVTVLALALWMSTAQAATYTLVDEDTLSSCAYVEADRKTICNHIHADVPASGPLLHVEYIITKQNGNLQCMRMQLYRPNPSIPGGREILDRDQIGAGVCQ